VIRLGLDDPGEVLTTVRLASELATSVISIIVEAPQALDSEEAENQ
jgi:hypothetical protein